MIEAGDIDVGLVRFPIGRACKARIFPAKRDVFMAALSADDPLARRNALKLADLANKTFVMYGAVAGLHAAAPLACQQASFLPTCTRKPCRCRR